MLSLMRRKAGSWMIKVILGAIVVVFVFWGVGSFRDDKAGSIASVNGDPISVEEYRNTYNNLLEVYRQNYGNSLNDELLKALGLRRDPGKEVPRLAAVHGTHRKRPALLPVLFRRREEEHALVFAVHDVVRASRDTRRTEIG